MTGGWAIRLYDPQEFRKGYDIVGNFKGFNKRVFDELIVFNGIYGLDSYLIWCIHPDLNGYDFSTVSLDLKLFPEMNKSRPFFQNKYRPVEVKFDPNLKKYVLFALSEDSIVLNTKLLEWEVSSISYKEDRKSYEILKEVLEDNDILAVQYFKGNDDELVELTYKQLTFDPHWTVRDFINYICDENGFEWYVYDRVLYVARELPIREKMVISETFDAMKDNVSSTSFFKRVVGDLRPANVLGHLDKTWRCIWVKHYVGKSGGVTKASFSKIGYGAVDKRLYLHTLDGRREIANATYIFAHNQFNSYSIGIGNILKDEGIAEYIDQISVQKDTDSYQVGNPNEMIFDRGNEDESSKLVYQKEKIPRTTPYLDEEAGIQFPSPKLDENKPPPNSIIFNVFGREESSVVGSYVMGNGGDLKIPYKKKEDFRLRFPNGGELYYEAERGVWFFQSPQGFVYKQAITSYDELPEKTRLSEDENMFQIWGGNVLWDTQTLHMHLMDGGCFQVIPKTGPQPDDPYRRYALICDNEYGKVYIEAQDELNIKIMYKSALSSGTINIDTASGTINIGAGASSVKLAGGGNKLAHANHTHGVISATDIFGLPLQGSTQACGDNTTKTEAD